MATTVGQHSVASFTSPVNGTTPIDANTVRGNDNTVRSAYVDHDADPGIHVQSSTLAARPTAGTAGRKWITSDYPQKLWYDDGTDWHEVGGDAITIYCKATETIAKGDIVKVTGYNTGQDVPEIAKVASASDVAFGIAESAIANGSLGYVVNTGIIQGVATNSFSIGNILYPNTSGGLTTTKPTSGNYQVVAYVLRAHATAGVLYVEFSAPRIVEASANTASTVVQRDASGNFSAGTITAGALTSTGLVTFASLKGTGATTVTNILDEDNMASDSATALATQQSIKAYVDAKVATVDTLAEVLANGNTTGANNIIVTAGQKITTDTIDETTSGSGVTIDSVLLKDDVVNATDIETGTISANNGALAITIANTTGALTLASALADSNLATISTAGKVSNSATTATSANTASAIVARDASGNFTAGTITAALTGNASTATALQTARTINGTSFDGTANITVTASAGTLTGTTLASNVVSSSLTSVGTLANLTVTNPISGSVTGSSGSTTGNAATATALQTARNINGVSFNGTADITVTAAAGTLTGTTLASGVTASSLTSVGTLTSLTVSGALNSTSTTASTSFATGAITTLGGVGITKGLYVGERIVTNDAKTGGTTAGDIVIRSANSYFVAHPTVATNAAYAVAGLNATDGTLLGNTAWETKITAATLVTVPVALTVSGDLTVDTSTLKVDSTNNRVGIGTASPSNDLDVSKSTASGSVIASVVNTSSTGAARIYLGNDGSASAGRLQIFGSSHAVRPGIMAIGTDASLPLVFDTAGAEKMRLDASGNLGLGVTPSAWDTLTAFQVKNAAVVGFGNRAYLQANTYYQTAVGNRYIAADFATRYTQDSGKHIWETAPSGSVGGTISFTQAMTLDASGNLLLGGATVGTNRKELVLQSANGSLLAMGIDGNAHSFRLTVDSGPNVLLNQTANAPMIFYTNNTERARITSGGAFCVAKTSDDDTIVGMNFRDTGYGTFTRSSSSNTDTTVHVYSTGAAAYRFYVGMGGTVYATNTTISAISDARLKENIRDLDVGLDAILSLKPRKYDWKEGKGQDKKDVRGFIAQEFEEVFPDLVDEWKDEAPEGEEPYRSVRQDLIPVLVKAIQELDAKNKALEARLEALEA